MTLYSTTDASPVVRLKKHAFANPAVPAGKMPVPPTMGISIGSQARVVAHYAQSAAVMLRACEYGFMFMCSWRLSPRGEGNLAPPTRAMTPARAPWSGVVPNMLTNPNSGDFSVIISLGDAHHRGGSSPRACRGSRSGGAAGLALSVAK
ncbi:hypothetical protein NL676_015422 [Syzygium grande]|nr:hypothetical protein NL676_015422 [Syzygium grande]